MAPKLFIVAVCGSYRTIEDGWFFADLKCAHSVLHRPGNEDREIWLTSEQTGHTDSEHYHGYADVERIRLPNPSNESWKTVVARGDLKREFLSAVRKTIRKAGRSDRIIILMNGHGNPRDGSIEVGTSDNQYPTLLRPTEVLGLVANSKSSILLIANSCYSGIWGEKAAVRLSQQRFITRPPTVRVLTRCEANDEILSFGMDADGKYRGEYFINFLVEALYLEHGFRFPRPNPVATEAPSEPTNLLEIPKLKMEGRTDNFTSLSSSFRTIFARVKGNLSRMSSVLPKPTYEEINVRDHNTPALEIFGVPRGGILELNFTELAPACPHPNSSWNQGRSGSIPILSSYYRFVPQLPANSASNIFFEMLEHKALAKNDTHAMEELIEVASARLCLFFKAKLFLYSHSIEIGGKYRGLKKKEREFWNRNHSRFEDFELRMPGRPNWNVALFLAIEACYQHGILPPKPRSKLQWAERGLSGLGGCWPMGCMMEGN